MIPILQAILQANSFQGYCGVAACTLVFYDHIITFSSEIELIWGRRFTSVTLIFHLNRWLIFLWAVIGLSSFHSLGALHSCIGVNVVTEVMAILLIVVWAAFSAVRMYAISGGNRWLAVTIFALCSAQSGVDVYGFFIGTWLQIHDLLHHNTGCDVGQDMTSSTSFALMVISRTCVVVADMLVLLVTWSKTYSIKRDAIRANTRALLATMLLRDGTVYFVVLLAANVINIIGWTSDTFTIASGEFTPALSSIVISHFLLDLRQLTYGSQERSFDISNPSFVRSECTGIRFASFVDNMGEELDYGFRSPERNADNITR